VSCPSSLKSKPSCAAWKSRSPITAWWRSRSAAPTCAGRCRRTSPGGSPAAACEALFHAGISPRRLAASVAGKRAERLVPAIRQVLQRAIDAGGSSLRDYVQTNGELGYFQHSFAVYGREGEPCLTCGAPVRRIVQSGRSTFYCGRCQT
jgi:formamidopyrimidine-DNA glycosylase